MAARKALLLRIDPRLKEALEKWADDELRSLNGQIEYLLARAVRDARRERRRPGGAGRPAGSEPEPRDPPAPGE